MKEEIRAAFVSSMIIGLSIIISTLIFVSAMETALAKGKDFFMKQKREILTIYHLEKKSLGNIIEK